MSSSCREARCLLEVETHGTDAGSRRGVSPSQFVTACLNANMERNESKEMLFAVPDVGEFAASQARSSGLSRGFAPSFPLPTPTTTSKGDDSGAYLEPPAAASPLIVAQEIGSAQVYALESLIFASRSCLHLQSSLDVCCNGF
ncbi:hypothetical protein PABG_11718 [Paracoccidioides brasiliensis Pb03]|nr:hypothetical protein PABG_11718 [Paracoccidioides brasiliensis Pb03]